MTYYPEDPRIEREDALIDAATERAFEEHERCPVGHAYDPQTEVDVEKVRVRRDEWTVTLRLTCPVFDCPDPDTVATFGDSRY